MPRFNETNEDNESRNSPYRSARREARSQAPKRGKPRHLSVRSEARDEPNLRKLAQAVLRIAMDEPDRSPKTKRRQAARCRR